MRRNLTVRTALTAGALAALLGVVGVTADASSDEAPTQHTKLLARSVLPAATFRTSPASGAQFTATDRANAAANGIAGPATLGVPYFSSQPVQGFSALVPNGDGTWWALSDNGYGTRPSSPDYQLAIYRIDPRFGNPAGPSVIQTVVLSDPNDHVKWKTICDPTGDPLPAFSFNVLLPPGPGTCDTAKNVLTGFDFDPESLQIGPDGSFWIGDEFGPFLLKFNRAGQLLAEPFCDQSLKTPQNPTLDISNPDPTKREQPNVGQSRGFEGLAISPDRKTLYPFLEGAITTDDAQTLRILKFNLRTEKFDGELVKYRLEMPGGKVNLVGLNFDAANGGGAVYPFAVAPTGTGGQSAAEITALDRNRYLVVERDGAGDGLAGPRFKKVFVVDTKKTDSSGFASKLLLVDLMAVPDPSKVGGDGDFFRFPFNTIESVHVVDNRTIVVADDNNFPFSNGRARSTTNERTTLGADANELILVQVGTSLNVDARLLNPPS